jgi:hypothetical protein
VANALTNYWEISERGPRRSSSPATKLVAAILILLLVISSGIVLLVQLIPNVQTQVRVGVLDSGVNESGRLQGRVVAARSFISTEYGYNVSENSTADSRPDDVPHGTLVATAIVEESQHSVIVNGRILDSNGSATTPGLIAAIYWAIDQNCSVINLSLGSSPTYGDPTEKAIEYALSKGIVVVAAAGNEGDHGRAGTSISSPGVFLDCIAVAALNESGEPFLSFSSTGPAASRYMKPDIAAAGYIQTSTYIYYGTSFASPRVAAAASELVFYCQTNNRPYTAGSIMTALLKGADSLPYPEYIVGAGAVNVANSIQVIASSPNPTELPAISYASPTRLPIDFEQLFYGDTYEFSLKLFASTTTVFDVQISGGTPGIFDVPSTVSVDQVGFVPLKVNVPASGSAYYDGTITFVSESSGTTHVAVHFSVSHASARVAFDISHTTWSIDTVYGQFRELYKKLTSNSISVTELRNTSQITFSLLSQFDAVLLLDPCVWDINETDAFHPSLFSVPFSDSEIAAYHQYFDNGGGLFVAALSNESLDIQSLNHFLGWTNFSLAYDEVGFLGGPALVTNITAHATTASVSNFDYLGATINVPGNATSLARYGPHTVLACLEGAGGGRIVISGSNFHVDNYGMTGQYKSFDDHILALKIVLWLSGLI